MKKFVFSHLTKKRSRVAEQLRKDDFTELKKITP